MEPHILREVSAMRRLRSHPHILELYEVLATRSRIYLVMELAPGGELLSRLRRHRRLPEPAARRYFHQVVSALRFCHRNGVFHRDIKPQNLLLDRNGLLKVTDFGLSALFDQKRAGGDLIHTACGTPAYTAPEVVRRSGYDGGKADAWSCGVLLYLFLVGSLPFDDGNLSNMYRAMNQRAFDLPDWLSRPAKMVIYKLLDPNPNTRMGLDELIGLSWFKKSYSENNLAARDIGPGFLDESELKHSPKVNAFDIISMSSGLNLSGLFEKETVCTEMRFFAIGVDVAEIEKKVAGAGVGLGYKIELGKVGGLIRMVKGGVVLVIQVRDVGSVGLWLLELNLVDGTVADLEDLQWEELKSGLKKEV
ncbi:CBL-interacting protein kinase 7 [Striga asiatica]|uniref:non-specific serine/threonine protein kinase n=1 Tax=Striga asiatica TaxID=4170 RepID=A0A5A7NYY6_STRAF|nr:CBL-interacting protein kinase 7 [Striga asiatica]